MGDFESSAWGRMLREGKSSPISQVGNVAQREKWAELREPHVQRITRGDAEDVKFDGAQFVGFPIAHQAGARGDLIVRFQVPKAYVHLIVPILAMVNSGKPMSVDVQLWEPASNER